MRRRKPKVIADLKAGDVLHYYEQLLVVLGDPKPHGYYPNDLVVVSYYNVTHGRLGSIVRGGLMSLQPTYSDVTFDS